MAAAAGLLEIATWAVVDVLSFRVGAADMVEMWCVDGGGELVD